jgi:hypothetical protein
MKNILIICFGIIYSSCATQKWKTAYINKYGEIMQKKYSAKSEFESVIVSGQFVAKPYKSLTRKDVRKNMRGFEKIFALSPDSVSSLGKNIDSFYTNKNKITYIKKNKLQTNNIHLLN